MPRKVTLYTSDSSRVYGNVLLPSDYPSDPSTLIWDGKVFAAGNIVYGSGSPGNYESYIESDVITLADEVVSPPNVIPTKIA